VIKICCIGKAGVGKSTFINLLLSKEYISCPPNKYITSYAPTDFRKIIEITKPKKFSFPQVEISEIALDEKSDSLTKYSLNVYDVIIFIDFLDSFETTKVNDTIEFYKEMIKNSDVKVLQQRIEKLQHDQRFGKSEILSGKLYALNSLLNMYKENKSLSLADLDNTSKSLVKELGLLGFSTIGMFFNTRYGKDYCNKFSISRRDGLRIVTYISDFLIYSEVKKEVSNNPNVLKELGIEQIDFDGLLPAILKHSDIIHFYTIVSSDVRAWQIRTQTSIKEAAGKIHKDFEKGFISAEVIKATDFLAYDGDIKKIKNAGKIKEVNKNYIVEDGDIVYIKFNV
jgi:ribosome-binding ATPase